MGKCSAWWSRQFWDRWSRMFHLPPLAAKPRAFGRRGGKIYLPNWPYSSGFWNGTARGRGRGRLFLWW